MEVSPSWNLLHSSSQLCTVAQWLEVAQEKPPTNTRLAAALIKSRRSAVDNGNATQRLGSCLLFAFKLQSHYTLNTFNSIFNLDPVRTPPLKCGIFHTFFDGFPNLILSKCKFKKLITLLFPLKSKQIEINCDIYSNFKKFNSSIVLTIMLA